VYLPDPVIVPQEADQLTATLAVNCCVELIFSVTVDGFTATRITLTLAVALEPEASLAVAVTVQRSAAAGAVNKPAVVTPPPLVVGQIRLQVTVVPLEVEYENCCVPKTGSVTSSGETVTCVPVGMETFSGRLTFPPAVSAIFRLPLKPPTVGDVNWIVTVQELPPATAPVQVLAEMVKVAEPESVTVGVTEPVPILDAVKTCVMGVLIVVCAVHCVGEIESGINVCWPVTVTVAVAVVPPFTAVAVIVYVPFVAGAV
jgi:hypothetical protein